MSNATRAAVLAALTNEWATIRQIQQKVDLWGRETIREVLIDLVAEGQALRYTEYVAANKSVGKYCLPHPYTGLIGTTHLASLAAVA